MKLGGGGRLRIGFPGFFVDNLLLLNTWNTRLEGSELVGYAKVLPVEEELIVDPASFYVVAVDKGYHPRFIIDVESEVHIHTHGALSPTPSATDEKLYKSVIAPVKTLDPQGRYGIGCIVSSSSLNGLEGRIRCFTVMGRLKDVDVEVEEDGSEKVKVVHRRNLGYRALLAWAREGDKPVPTLTIMGTAPLGGDPHDYVRLVGVYARYGSRRFYVSKVYGCRPAGSFIHFYCSERRYIVEVRTGKPEPSVEERLVEVDVDTIDSIDITKPLWRNYLRRAVGYHDQF